MSNSATDLAANPLLDRSALPRFDAIAPEHIEPAIRGLLAELETELADVESTADPGWDGTVAAIERLQDKLSFSWGAASHLMGVANSDELRAAYQACQPDVVAFSMRVGQSQPLFAALKSLRSGSEWSQLDAAQQRIVETLILDAELAGVGLAGDARERFNEIQRELAELATKFGNNVLDATKEYALVLRDADDIAGLPSSLVELLAQSARGAGEAEASGESGPWRITLDYPSFGPFLEHSQRRDLRQQVYRAFITRASSGELDNSPVLEKLLALRREEAGLLGFESYAEVSLSRKMAPDVAAAEKLLTDLLEASHGAAHREFAELAEFARSQAGAGAPELAHWDVAYWAERMREERYAYSEEELRPYFPLPRVLSGLFGLAKRLFDVEIEAADGEAAVWHEDVRFFRVRGSDGEPIAAFYLDPYSRPAQKRGGAWMDECVGRTRVFGELRLPVAHLVCNGTPPVGDKPSLMTFGEVETLFHEFGHGLQHMLTRVDYGLASGIRNVEWDAVELPSQFMENWLYQRETIRATSAHIETGEPLPQALLDKICAARTYRAGSQMLRQLHFGFVDLELHHRYQGGETSAFDVQRLIAETTTVLPPLAEDRFLCSFTHIFGGGYAAGYYSYKWAEVLSADAFAAFEEAGIDDPRALASTGRRYRDTVLALGGSRAPMEVFVAFRGREPSPEPLLRNAGLLPEAVAP